MYGIKWSNYSNPIFFANEFALLQNFVIAVLKCEMPDTDKQSCKIEFWLCILSNRAIEQRFDNVMFANAQLMDHLSNMQQMHNDMMQNIGNKLFNMNNNANK